MSTPTIKRFASPYDDAPPPEAAGWEELYPYYLHFREDRREAEEARFWFADTQHWPTVFKPFDTITVEFAIRCLGQYNTRHYVIPPANGIDYRVHNGYVYMSPVGVPEEEIPARVPEFLERAGYYFANWPSLLENWHSKIRGVIGELEAIRFEPLPERVPLGDITSGKGLDPHAAMTHDYNRLIELAYTAFQYHFEFLNLGYVAYLDFFGFCQEAFPGISDLGIAKMVQGIEVDLFRPDDELKRLALLAVSRDVDVSRGLSGITDEVWLDAWEAAKDPWFNFSSGSGMYSTDKVWLDHLEIPFGFMAGYVGELRAGKDIARPTAAISAERDRVTSEYRALLPADAQEAFDAKLGLSRLVFPYVENHNFYIEHWSLSLFWRRVRELGQVLADAGFWADADDIFLLRRDEVPQALFDYGNGWAVGAECAGPYHWPAELERRKGILAALGSKPPLPAMNEPPAVVTEPFTIMLYGITSERVGQWLSGGESDAGLSGMAASPGAVEGVARVVLDADALASIQPGEILVSRITAPSWGPVFSQISAVVTDIGGMMSHAAIVCREYGLPAVTGTGSATTAIQTGQRIRVDGDSGTVTLVS
ncbi:PEP-utilizing enzyme [Solirubrobacter soli]|uniref:PEP-utilizing enzyme n=1 Tax=Solirubrobacter soli TaxID=363832 RepID=UPI00042960C7|nr:PEP-utilizing enzyme [Solirubrobacter soli]